MNVKRKAKEKERKKERRENMAPLLRKFEETPFKNKSEIHDELMADFGKIIVNGSHLQRSQVQVRSIECFRELFRYF